ncbi:aldo/keto reductase [Lysobacter sp. HDW10]|jgi:voltage-dependent potassium channel beta subunit|uniref:aldo/keto reductase n=1 Tax=Lysobacter sp. HDW10 TaxID=2714936 RepID=UPI00140D99FF|nr:aldo/keto reductase [Lysobacter sp. HDW10]QIK81123.1 aldo/keto reductase [Lysobacter sp. HDW10]
MEYRRLGRAGLQLSALSLGAWLTFGRGSARGEARNLVAAAWDHGVNFFDNAEVYGHGEGEQVMGDVIADLRLPRDGYVVSSKAFFGSVKGPLPTQRGLSRKHLHDACHAAMRRLRVDYLDLYYCHRPDDEVPLEEIVMTMDALVRQGKVMYWGTSEWPASQIQEALRIADAHGWVGPSMEQPQYNVLVRERFEQEYARLFDEWGLGATTWSPLASGLLTGKYADGIPEGSRLAQARNAWLLEDMQSDGQNRMTRASAFAALARSRDLDPAQLAIAWVLSNPKVTSVILGASSVAQLLKNLQALAYVGSIDEALSEAISAL